MKTNEQKQGKTRLPEPEPEQMEKRLLRAFRCGDQRKQYLILRFAEQLTR